MGRGVAPRGSVDVWLADPERVNGAVDEARTSWLSAEERARLEATLGLRARRERFAAYLLARWALARRLGCRPAEVLIARDDEGRPKPVPAPAGAVEVSLAHTRGMVVCGVAQNARLGVDAERLRPRAGAGAIARRFFHPEEVRALEAAPAAERVDRFWALWTLKEALVKAARLDLCDGLGACAFELDERGRVEARLANADRASRIRGRWTFRLVAPSEAHYVAVAASVDGDRVLSAVAVHDVTAELLASVARGGAVGG